MIQRHLKNSQIAEVSLWQIVEEIDRWNQSWSDSLVAHFYGNFHDGFLSIDSNINEKINAIAEVLQNLNSLVNASNLVTFFNDYMLSIAKYLNTITNLMGYIYIYIY